MEMGSEPDPAPTPLTVKTFFAEIKTFRPESDCDREWVRYTSAIEQSADRDLAQRDDELGAKFREFMASSNPMDQHIAATLGAALLGPVRRGAPALLANATCSLERGARDACGVASMRR
mmetsp:Transcript_50221/g.162208  ORF Transcript_50221/g.162208 Transcript_50221/m.162208 type:complete len:119 (+) Transcript_50221:666-1022(+)